VKAAHSNSRHWAAINELGFMAGMRFLFWICRVFGRWPFRLVLYPVLLWYVLTKPAARRASQDYLRRAGALVPLNAGLTGVVRHFAAFAETMLDKMLLWGGLYQLDAVKFMGAELMRQNLLEQRGAVLVCAHLGNVELCRVLSRQRSGLRLTILVHTKHAQAFNAMLAGVAPESQLNLLQVTEMSAATAMLLADRIEQGEFVVIAGDRIPVASNPRVAEVPFLGAPAAFPIGPYVLASVLQCPLYMLFSLQRKDGAEIHFELLREVVALPRKGRDEALRVLATEYAARLQHHCLSAPLQWFNFYDFWHLPEPETGHDQHA
jgi:predicted LPLAT superfamily acyltransferase